MDIRPVYTGKKRYLPLLLLADEQEDMIDRYLDRGDLYALEEAGEPCALCVVTDEGGGLLELKNIAVRPDCQRKGYGRALIQFLLRRYQSRFHTLQVGTGDSPLTVPFYESCGFRRSHIIANFFLEHYDHPIVEAGVTLRDMVYLTRPISCGGAPSSPYHQKGVFSMHIRRAREEDMPGLIRLLYQVADVHHQGRPELFRPNAKKYTDEELRQLIHDDQKPIFAGIDEETGDLLGYAFCALQRPHGQHALVDIKTLYIDDLCVDESCRGKHVGKQLYDFVRTFAKEQGCYNLTLNVWACNEKALGFYEKLGLKPQKIGMETIL